VTRRPPLPTGTRIRLNERCVWPDRVGAEGVVVDSPDPRIYPSPIPEHEVLILLDDDPLARARDRHLGWTCVTSRASVDVIDQERPT
jgi:hypothetical protein